MAQEDIHRTKCRGFKAAAENEDNFIPVRIGSYFEAAFHLIESVAARYGVHIDVHTRVRSALETNNDLFRDMTDAVWREFQELEKRIRPGQIYGGKINGENLRRAKEIFTKIENICEELPCKRS